VGALNLFIDYNFFPDVLPLTVMGATWPVVWYFYFSNSQRVYWVLAQGYLGGWSYDAFCESKLRVGR
jgi:hypothetical protein